MNARRPRIGLLPLYLKLYDDTSPERRAEFDGLRKKVTDGLAGRKIDVVESAVCRVADEFEGALALFESREVDSILTLHLAYSPSMESADALCRSSVPVIMLDTTMDPGFGKNVDPSRIAYNHGIHGVMDLASVLRRRGKPFQIVAGHVTESDVLDRAAAMIRAAHSAACFRRTRALRIGAPFAGMADFAVPDDLLFRRFGVTIEQIEPKQLAAEARSVSKQEISAEIAADQARFTCRVPEVAHVRSLRVGLALRKRLERDGHSAFSMNFMAFTTAAGPINTVPFLEASKAMARGIGYAGEGDLLTASLVGALLRGFGETTFTEIFCPDWRGNTLFISHMGEINPTLAAGKPHLIEKDFPYTRAHDPAALVCAVKKGAGTFVNLAPGPDETFRLLLTPVQVLGDTKTQALHGMIRGWLKPPMPIPAFLEAYSQAGGTHHSALVMNTGPEPLAAMADMLGIEHIVLG